MQTVGQSPGFPRRRRCTRGNDEETLIHGKTIRMKVDAGDTNRETGVLDE